MGVGGRPPPPVEWRGEDGEESQEGIGGDGGGDGGRGRSVLGGDGSACGD